MKSKKRATLLDIPENKMFRKSEGKGMCLWLVTVKIYLYQRMILNPLRYL